MNDYADLALLPEGLHDELPPEAEHEIEVLRGLAATFASFGYERVKPPLVEFEESLLTGPGAGVSRHMFRLMDPISQRMMGMRSDMTTQVARIATTRLANKGRPLRLFYSGQVLRVRGTQLRPGRQFTQAGVELIGQESTAGDAEAILLAAEALSAVGVEDLSIDLTLPSLVPLLCDAYDLSDDVAAEICRALDQKDGAALEALQVPGGDIFRALMDAAGLVDGTLDILRHMELPVPAQNLCDKLIAAVDLIRAENGALVLTADPGESRDFEYQTGVSFTLFAKGVRGELGRGGRYRLSSGESAIGFTLYLDTLVRATDAPKRPKRIYLPHGTGGDKGASLRGEGWQTVRGLLPEEKPIDAAARSAGCTHIYTDGNAIAL
jgi:ATP phosphoribosyltransferase regulatory subunit